MSRPTVSDAATKYTYQESIKHAVFPALKAVNEKRVCDGISAQIPGRSFIVGQSPIVFHSPIGAVVSIASGIPSCFLFHWFIYFGFLLFIIWAVRFFFCFLRATANRTALARKKETTGRCQKRPNSRTCFPHPWKLFFFFFFISMGEGGGEGKGARGGGGEGGHQHLFWQGKPRSGVINFSLLTGEVHVRATTRWW